VIAIPPRLTFHLTDRCRYRCKFCFVPPIRDARELPATVWEKAAGEAAALRPGCEIILTGGEPLLFDGVFAISKAAARQGAVVHLNSAGIDLGPEQARRLAGAGVRHVNLSLDGPPPVHNRLRGQADAYRLVQEALDNLAGNAPAVRRNIVAVAMGANLDVLPEFLAGLDADERVDGIYLQLITNPEGPAGSDRWLYDADLFPPDAETRRVGYARLLETKQTLRKILNPPEALELQARFFADPHDRLPGRCRVADFGFCLDPRGDLSLCGFFPPAGNIARTSLADLLRGEAYARIREDMRSCRRGCHRHVNCATALGETVL